MNLLAAGNPFIDSYLQSDWFGKVIFLALFALSFLTWTVLIHKAWLYKKVEKLSIDFADLFNEKDPLNLQFTRPKTTSLEVPHPFFELYKALKQKLLQLISRNHLYASGSETILSEADLGLIDSSLQSALAKQNKILEKNLFILSTIATLAPFLGLLGTVWGILLTFSQMNGKGVSGDNSMMLSGLSMALTTTVIGLVIAIPAFAGYNYLKNKAREYRREMEDFSQFILAAVELQYRKPDHAQKIPISTG